MILLYVFLSFIILLFVFLYIITLFLNWNNFVISRVDDEYIIIDKEFCKETNKKGLDINVYTFILFCLQNTEICKIKIIRLFSKQFVIKD